MATDLKALQDRLNSDDAVFRSEFLANPVKSLEAAGLILPDAAKKRLVDLVTKLRTKQPTEPGPRPPQIYLYIVPDKE